MQNNTFYIVECDEKDTEIMMNYLRENNIVVKNKLFSTTNQDIVIYCDELFINEVNEKYDVKISKYIDLRSKL
jgi:hypothetical protein